MYVRVTLLKSSRHHHQLMTVSISGEKSLPCFVGKGWRMRTQCYQALFSPPPREPGDEARSRDYNGQGAPYIKFSREPR